MKPLKNILLLLLLLASCGSSERGRMLAVLDEADSLNRNYIPFTTDSVLKEAAEWFDSHGSANERVRAHYLLGCAYRDMGEAPAALQSYHDAVDCADTTATDCDYRLLSRVHGQMADLFYWQESSANALQECIMVDKYARLAKDTMMIIANNNKRSDIYELEEKWDLLVLTQEKNAQECLRYGNKQEYAVALGGCLVSILGGNDYDKEKFSRYIEIYEDQSGLFDDTGSIQRGYEIFYYLKGLHLLYLQHKHEAEKYFRKLITSGTDLNDSLAAYRGLYLLYNSEQRIDSVAKYADLCYQYNDKSYKETCTTHIQQLQSQYNYQRFQKEADRTELISSRKTWAIWLCLAIIFCLILLVVIGNLLHRSYRRKMRIRNEYLLSRLALLESEMSVKKISITEEELQTSPLVTKFREYATNKSVKPTYDDWSELRMKMDNAFPRLMSILTDSKYGLQLAEIEISMLIRLRFSTTQIAFLTGYTNSGVGNIRRKLLRVIFKEDGGAKDFNYKIIQLN